MMRTENLLYKTDARGILTTVAYDVLNRPTSKSYSGDGGITPAVAYFYDSDQRTSSGAAQLLLGYTVGKTVAVTYWRAAVPVITPGSMLSVARCGQFNRRILLTT